MSQAKQIVKKYLAFSGKPGQVRRKPVKIVFMVWDGTNLEEIRNFTGGRARQKEEQAESYKLLIDTLEGEMTAKQGDAIIKGVEGEVYACDPKVFFKTYDFID